MTASFFQKPNSLPQEEERETLIAFFYKNVIEQSPTAYDSYQKLGECFAKLNRWNEAISCYEKAIELKPDESELYCSLGGCLEQRAKLHLVEAINAYQRVIQINPKSVQAFEALLNIQPNNEELWWTLGDVYARHGEGEQAKIAYDRVIQLNPERTEQAYQRLVEIEPDNWELWWQLGVYAQQQNHPQVAIAAYQKVIQLNSDFLGVYQNLVALQPGNWEAWLYLGNIHAKRKEYKSADIAYNHVMQLIGQDYTQVYKKQLEIEPKEWEVWLQLGRAYARHNRPNGAFFAYQQVIKLNPNQIEGYYYTILSPEWTGAIGHIACLDQIVKMGLLGLRPFRILLNASGSIANQCYLNYWRRYLSMMDSPFQDANLSPPTMMYIHEKTANWYYKGQWIYHGQAGGLVQKQWELETRPPLLTLSSSDYERGWECLHKLGVPKDSWFVTLHVREQVNGDSYAPIRRADISTYSLAIESIVARGGWIIRIGHQGMPPLLGIEQMIDLTRSDLNNEFMNLFLLSSCRFFLGMPSGPYFVSSSFGVPCVITNWANFWIHAWYGNTIFIPKVYRLETESRSLTFSEVLEKLTPLEYIMSAQKQYLDSLGITIVDNTPEEINDAVTEMLEKLDGKANYTAEDESRQALFNQVLEAHKSYGNGKGGKDFLKKYAHLLV
ncbi:TIGR04372 family glycosyltransferase [Microcoleus sp. B7-D4]|uniref:TIGR04372 family glycosyltransferase n=1 Tax=Microcoleus sp. B7-D4 TaxID=2818696 RepID=UPI002FCF883E